MRWLRWMGLMRWLRWLRWERGARHWCTAAWGALSFVVVEKLAGALEPVANGAGGEEFFGFADAGF
jgi:hypothetical protein